MTKTEKPTTKAEAKKNVNVSVPKKQEIAKAPVKEEKKTEVEEGVKKDEKKKPISKKSVVKKEKGFLGVSS